MLNKKWVLLVAMIVLLQTSLPSARVLADASEGPTLTLKSEAPITSGAVLKKYQWETVRGGKSAEVDANVIQVDLKNPNVKLDVLTGKGDQFTKKQTVLGMAEERGAVAGVNGDFFDTHADGAPIGPEIESSRLMATPPYLRGFYSFALDKNNTPIIDQFTFQGSIKAKDGATYPLGGINKTYYWYEADSPTPPTPITDNLDGVQSMIDGLYMYTNAWGQIDRANDGVTNPTEILVQNNVITKIGHDELIQSIPPKDGYILRAAGKATDFVLAHMHEGDPISANYSILPLDTQQHYDTNNFKMMIGGGTILVDQGQPANFTRTDADDSGYRSRTAVGYSQDMQYAYIITADHYGDSRGMSLHDMQNLMLHIGVWKGMNFDGGGSTQMVARPLGEFDDQLVNNTENNSQRQVVNGLGVFSIAPPGQIKQFTIDGETKLLINEKATYSLSGYDQYYNPVHMENAVPNWQTSNSLGTFQGNVFTASQPGETVLTATYGDAKQSVKVQVIGRDQIAKMKIEPSSSLIAENSDIRLPVTITTKDGATKTAPPESIQWELKGLEGKFEGDVLHVSKLTNMQQAQIIAHYDGFSTMVALPVGLWKTWADFDQMTPSVQFDKYPAEVSGDASVFTGLQGKASNDHSLYLRYDFTHGSGTKAAYALFGDSGLPVDGQPQSMRINVWGDNSLNWLRAEFIDANGTKHIADVAKVINWNGWRTLDVGLSDLHMAYPVTLKRIYVADIEQGQDERAEQGAISLDDISFLYQGNMPASAKSSIKLTIDSNTMMINNKPSTIDQPPVIVNDNTLVPVRFVIEALGGQIGWDDAERKVTVLKDAHLIDMWVDQKDLIMDGERVTAEVAPQIINDRTMVPLRLLSEKLGWKVTWDNDTRSITLE